MSQYKNDIFYYASQLPAPNTPEPNQNSQIYTATPIPPFHTPTPRLDEGIHSSSRKRKPKRTEEEKLEHMLGVLNKLTWTLSEFLYMLFRVKDDQGQKVTRNQKHVGIVSCFLGGATKYTVGQVLEAWLCDSSRKPHHNSAEHSAMFSPIALYSHQKHAHVAITAAQLVLKELEREIQVVTRSDSGLQGYKASTDNYIHLKDSHQQKSSALLILHVPPMPVACLQQGRYCTLPVVLNTHYLGMAAMSLKHSAGPQHAVCYSAWRSKPQPKSLNLVKVTSLLG